MRTLLLSLVGTCCLLLASCPSGSSKPQDLILGKWINKVGAYEEYTTDGKVKNYREGTPAIVNDYRFVDDNTIEYTNRTGQKKIYKVAVTRNELTLTGEDNRVEKLRSIADELR